MSFKAIILLTRAQDTTHEQFSDWWLTRHAPLARQLPNLRRCVFNLVDSPVGDSPADRDPADRSPDGVAELWFDSQKDFESAYASEIGKSVVADSMSNVSVRRRMFVVENIIHSE